MLRERYPEYQVSRPYRADPGKYALTTATFTRSSTAAVKSDVVPPPDAPSVAMRDESTSGLVAR